MDEVIYPTECPDCNGRIHQFNAKFDYNEMVYKCKECVEDETL